ncbi:phosphate signaling complex protein PhoU [Magnetospira sp. QH-2]|uniref:phosphate signaling complex protein PhoU n=1 Tax=Magnetospira sp. (strain QH-2) TaxID=1288970 RepID=UPI0003E815E6|nr:phosphate signaling complex protein PhoU [Magnetospira sp. QH-2]CCQ73395.1 Transcriptional repressor for high-affinity phosphate uptake [Magnetospira sp. QH-2]
MPQDTEHEHTNRAFEQELKTLENTVAKMGGLVEAQFSDAILALVRGNTKLSTEVMAHDERIDEMEREIDQMTLRILALRHPHADDLRAVIAALKVASTLERMGDYAKNVAKRNLALAKAPAFSGAITTISRMGTLVQEMVKNVLDAYLSRDTEMATDVWNRDEEVDQLHTSLFRELLTYMMEDHRNITACTHLLFIAKNLERIGDHATFIAEQVHFLVEGEIPDQERPKDDSTSTTVVEIDA